MVEQGRKTTPIMRHSAQRVVGREGENSDSFRRCLFNSELREIAPHVRLRHQTGDVFRLYRTTVEYPQRVSSWRSQFGRWMAVEFYHRYNQGGG